jgi:hypothetical protein
MSYEWLKPNDRMDSLTFGMGPGFQWFLTDRRGVTLFWGFDVEPTLSILVARLTFGEAKKVVERDVLHEGLLEPVRRTMKTREASIVFDEETPQEQVRLFDIPAAGSEPEFIDAIFAARSRQPAPHAVAKTVRTLSSRLHVPATV